MRQSPRSKVKGKRVKGIYRQIKNPEPILEARKGLVKISLSFVRGQSSDRWVNSWPS